MHMHSGMIKALQYAYPDEFFFQKSMYTFTRMRSNKNNNKISWREETALGF